MATQKTNITEAIVQVGDEAARVAVQMMAVAKEENSRLHKGTQNVGPKIGSTYEETTHTQLGSRR